MYLDPSTCRDGNAIPFEDIARVYLWAAEQPVTPDTIALQVELAEWCSARGLFRWLYDDGVLCGFGEWFRLNLESVPLLSQMQEQRGWLQLTEDEIMNGPVLYWANGFTLKPGLVWKDGQDLARLPGVTHCAGWSRCRLHISTVDEVFKCRSLRQWLSQT